MGSSEVCGVVDSRGGTAGLSGGLRRLRVFVPPSSCWLHPQTVFPGRRKLAARSVAASLGSRAESGSLCVRESQLTGSLWQPFLHVGKKLITLAKKQGRPSTNQPILKFERTLKRGSMSCLHTHTLLLLFSFQL